MTPLFTDDELSPLRRHLPPIAGQLHLGYEVGTGRSVAIPLAHMAVVGQTQRSGKTTTLEALITRGELRSLVFITKRGEGSFLTGRRISPYFRHQSDWRFVAAILESVMRERMKFERSWIMKATKGTKTLADVRARVVELGAASKRSMDQDVYLMLGEYLDIVVPEIEALPATREIELRPGLNVMDLRAYSPQLQGLVVASAIEWIAEREQNTVAVVPEAWKFMPQGRTSPVKMAAQRLTREGAALSNFVWLDMQDLAGTEKEMLRSATVWLMGVQREANEVRRTLAHIPETVRKPKPADVATLRQGQFWACWEETAVKVYVQPVWLTDAVAMNVAVGRMQAPPRPMRHVIVPPGDVATDEEVMEVARQRERMFSSEEEMPNSTDKKLDELTTSIQSLAQVVGQALGAQAKNGVSPSVKASRGKEIQESESPLPVEMASWGQLYEYVRQRLIDDAPHILKTLVKRPELVVEVTIEEIVIDGSTLRGRIAQLIADKWFDDSKRNVEVLNKLAESGYKTAHPQVSMEMKALAQLGYIQITGEGYRAVPDMKIRIRRK